MLRGGLLRDVDLSGDVTYSARAGAQKAHDGQPPRLTEGLECQGRLLFRALHKCPLV